ncbi:MAG TPA: oxygenase MpaB family protein [Acidimicrobiales bacterium]|nr:oxygenase MpaB family protein [Acidimicrobiales bacterium]
MSDVTISPALRGVVFSGLALAPAGANVVMQLAQLPVGHGVAESRVESGALTQHPIKRTRTTLGYIVAVLLGDDEMREYIRREVNRQHREVHSREGDAVAYNAFDPELQLWVAACMYRGSLDAVRLVSADVSDDLLDELYGHCARFATTLQVPFERWPQDRSAFDEYWNEALGLVEMDAVTREYLTGIVQLRFLPRALRTWLGPLHEFVVSGFLAPVFREQLGLSWSHERQRRFEGVCRVSASVYRVLPGALREFPLNLVWWDTQRRFRAGRSFV